MPGIKIPNGITGDIFWTLFSQNHRPCFVPTVLPRIRFGPSPFCKSHLAPRQRQTSSIDLSWPHCLRWKEVRFNQSGVGTQFTGPHVVAHSKPPKSDRRKVSPLLRLPHSTPMVQSLPMHCKAVVANILTLPARSRGQSAKTNLVRSNYSAAAAGPTPERRKDAPFWKRSQISSFQSLTSLGNGIRPTFLGYGENGRAALSLSGRGWPNITVIPAQIESTTRWNEMK